jgi:hypothetical protein
MMHVAMPTPATIGRSLNLRLTTSEQPGAKLLSMKRPAIPAVVLCLLVAAGSASAARVRMVVAPASVSPGAAIRVSAAASPCLARDQITLISSAFPGHAFGEGAVYGRIGPRGSFAVTTRIRRGLPAGLYRVGARCGGGNLGVSVSFRVR